jgi:rubredoxin
MMSAAAYRCPVCGYDGLEGPPRSALTGAGSYEICPSCGFEFGVSDDDLGYTYDEWRKSWVDRGMPWESAAIRPAPDGWDPVAQLRALTSDAEG